MANDPLAARGVFTLNDSSANQSAPRAPQTPGPPPPPPPPPLLKQGQAPPPVKQQQQQQPQRQQVPKMDQTQVRAQAQPRATIDLSAFQQQSQMDWGLNQSLGVSDFRAEQMSEEEAREHLSEYAIYRLEKRRDDDRMGLDRGGSAWEFARTIEVRDLSKEDASAFIRQRDEEGRSIVEERASFPLPLQDLVERTHVSLTKQESEPANFHWVLADLYSVKQKIDRHTAGYHGSRSSYYGDAKQYNSSRRSKHTRGGGSKSKRERVSVTMFFKRVPRPTVSALAILEQQRLNAASIQKRAITAQQMQDNELNEQLQRAQQQSFQRQMEAQQRIRAFEASILQQQQQQENQQKLQQKLFEQQLLQQQQNVQALQQQQQQQQRVQALQQQAVHPNQARAQQFLAQGGPQVHQQNMPPGVGNGAGRPPVPPPPPIQARGTIPPTAPAPPKPRNAQQAQQQQQKPAAKGQTRQQAARPRAYSGSADPGSPRSSRESIGSEDDDSYCDTADTPLSSQASDTPRSRRGRARSRSRSRSRSRDRCHGRCKSHAEEAGYGFEPVRRMSRHDQHYILENQVPARGMLRGREMFSPEPTVSLQQLESIKQEAYDAGMRAVTRADRSVEEMIYRQRMAPPPQVIQRQHSVRVVPPPRMVEDDFEFQRLRIDDDLYERRRLEEEYARRRQEEDYERRRQEVEFDRRGYDTPEANYYPLESPRREIEERDYMRTRDWVSGEYENPFVPFDGGRRGSYGRGR